MKIRYILFCLVLMMTGYASADIYQVSDINISAEQETTSAARDAAILQGQTDAFWTLMHRMVLPENQEKIPLPNQNDLNSFVKTFSLANEKTTPTKYMATISVQFKPDAIQNFFILNKIPFLTEVMPKTLIIPILKQDGEMLTFEENNFFFQFLKQYPIQGHLFEPILPIGDLDDLNLAHQILTSDPKIWKPLLEKYNCENAFVIVMEKQDNLYVYQAEFLPNIYHDSFQISNTFEENRFDDMSSMAQFNRPILEQVESQWLLEHTNDLSQPLTYHIQISIDNLGVWNQIEKKLKSAEFLNGVFVRAFRPKEIIVSVQYRGVERYLNHQLNTIGFEIVPSDVNDNLWVLLPYQGERS